MNLDHGNVESREDITTLKELKATPNGCIMFVGDCGGWEYLICMATIIQCDMSTIQQLIKDIAVIELETSERDFWIEFSTYDFDTVENNATTEELRKSGICIDKEYVEGGDAHLIEAVLRGQRPRIGTDKEIEKLRIKYMERTRISVLKHQKEL